MEMVTRPREGQRKEKKKKDYVKPVENKMLPDATTQGRLDVGTIRGF